MNAVKPNLSQTPDGPYQIVKIDPIFIGSFTWDFSGRGTGRKERKGI